MPDMWKEKGRLFEMNKFEKINRIISYRIEVGDRIDRRFGAFTQKAMVLHEENTRRLKEETTKMRGEKR